MPIHNRINYIEFEDPDLESIKVFYGKVFGWKFTDYGPEYAAFNDGALDGGFAKGTRKSAGSPLVILYSEDLESTREEIRRGGGSIIRDIYSFPGGRRFHFGDVAGNELAVWSDNE